MSNFERLNEEIDNSEHLGYRLSYRVFEAMSQEFSQRNPSRGASNKDVEKMPEDAYNLICKFMDQCEALKGPENYDKQAISDDLAKACAEIPVETPEMAAKLIKTTSELFSMRSDAQGVEFQLETFAKQGQFLGDEKVAEAYLDATSKSISLLDDRHMCFDSCVAALEKYKGIVADHPEMAAKVLDAVLIAQSKFPDSPSWQNCANEILKSIADNEKTDAKTRNAAKDKLPNLETTQPLAETGLRMMEGEPKNNQSENKNESRTSKWPSVKNKAKIFIRTSKPYAAGKNLFSKFKEDMKKIIKENPKLCTGYGAAVMIGGIVAADAALLAGGMAATAAAAGAVIMTLGAKELVNKIKNMRGLDKSESGIKMQSPKSLTLDNAIRKNMSSRGER